MDGWNNNDMSPDKQLSIKEIIITKSLKKAIKQVNPMYSWKCMNLFHVLWKNDMRHFCTINKM